MSKLIEWFQELKYIVRNYASDIAKKDQQILDLRKQLAAASQKADRTNQLLRDRTDMGVDISYSRKEDSWVILVGRFKGQDYVQTFSMNSENFDGMIQICREMQKTAVLRRCDAPPIFRSVLERER